MEVFEGSIITGACSFAYVYISYFVFADLAYRFLWQAPDQRWQHKRIQRQFPDAGQVAEEIRLSTVTTIFFGVMIALIYAIDSLGWTQIYWTISDYGWPYLALSVAVIAVVHDTYYYWVHRLMHVPKLFKIVHKQHHSFVNPTPFSALAFHPLEGLIEIGIIGLLLFVMPLHPLAMAIYLMILTFLNMVSHVGYELYPRWVHKYFITSTHHNLHHSRANGHYMLLFPFWDRLMGTNHAEYEEIFEGLADAKPAGKTYQQAHSPSR